MNNEEIKDVKEESTIILQLYGETSTFSRDGRIFDASVISVAWKCGYDLKKNDKDNEISMQRGRYADVH